MHVLTTFVLDVVELTSVVVQQGIPTSLVLPVGSTVLSVAVFHVSATVVLAVGGQTDDVAVGVQTDDVVGGEVVIQGSVRSSNNPPMSSVTRHF